MKKFIMAILLLNAIILSSYAQQQVPIVRFMMLDKYIGRGGRPGEIGLQALKRMGFKSIINLEDNQREASKEQSMAKALGIKTYSFPMSTFAYPVDDYVNRIYTELTKQSNWPIYLHCQFGKDRTGMISALYRVREQYWTPEEAYEEMLYIGFSPFLLNMKDYFFKKTSRRY